MKYFIDNKKIDIFQLKKIGVFNDSKVTSLSWDEFGIFKYEDLVGNTVAVKKIPNEDYLEIGYIPIIQHEHNKQYIYKIKLVKIETNFGHYYYNFICPLSVNGKFCGKRVRILYKPEDSPYFGCRHCHRIRYPTQIFNKRHPNHEDIKRFQIETKIEILEDKIKRKIYRGVKTKKQEKLEMLYKEAEKY
jgi:hypothetical protein